MASTTRSTEASIEKTSLDRSGDREIVIRRTIAGPARLVFDAWTRPELVRRWWAPKSHGVSLKSCEADVRAGGRYRYVMEHRDGKDLAFFGVYKEVTRPSRLIYTSVFEPMRDAGETLVTATFEERDGRTEIVLHEVYPSKQALDATLATGMERGMRESFDQLEAVVVDEVGRSAGGPPLHASGSPSQ